MDAERQANRYLDQKYDIRKYMFDSELGRALTGEEFVLNYLAFHAAPVFPKELSESMKTSTARIAAILRHLEKEKLIELEYDSRDARRHSIRLNKAGRVLASKLRRQKTALIEKIFERLGETETAEYIIITQHIIDICSEIRKD